MNEGRTSGLLSREEDGSARSPAPVHDGDISLRWRDALLASLTSASPLALYAVDDRTDAVLHVSDRFLSMFRVESLGERIRRGAASNAEVMRACAAATADPGAFLRASAPPRAGAPPACSTDEIDFADGRVVRRFTSPIGLEPGESVGRFFVLEDVTPHRRMMRLFDNSQVIMFRWVAAPGWPVEACSRSVAQWGYAPEDFTSGRVPYASVVHPDDLERVAREVGEFSEAGFDRFRQVYRVRTSDGRVRHLDDHTLVVRDAAGRITHYEGTILDVTERNELLEQLVQAQKMEAVGLLAGGIAHDFNNVLMAINLSCEALLRKELPPERRRALVEDVRAAGMRASALTRRLLAFTRRKALERRPVDLSAVVLDIESMLRRLIGEDVALVTRLAEGLRPVIADPGQVEQVIVNLALNARDAMPGGGRCTISTESVPPSGDGAGARVRLSVEDTGTGMDAATLARIFEPFFTTKRPGKGTGLGLSTVKRIVDQDGGTIRVESAPGKGAHFTIELPAAPEGTRVEPASPAGGVPAAPSAREGAGGERILLVEDDDAVRRLVGDILRERGYEVLEARRGEEALALAAREGARVDVLVTDVVMPEMSGPDLARRLARERPDLPVVYLSGYADDTLAAHDLVGPHVRLLQKPVGHEALAQAVRAALDARTGAG